MSNVVRLAVENTRPAHNACTDCAHFHPDTHSFGEEGGNVFGFGKRPTANAMRFAICTVHGGEYASMARRRCEGNLWDAKP